MKRSVPGALAGIVVALALAAPALAAPSNVTVRVEGDGATLQPRTAVTTDTQPVLVEGANACSGTSAGGALYKAVGGAVGGTWGGFGFQLLTIKGETHDDVTDPSLYWSFWVNYEFQNQGLCATELQEGDDVLMLVDCFSATAQCAARTPLRLSGVPATVAPGETVTLKVEQFVTAFDPATNRTNTTPEPAAGATIAAAGQTVTTDAAGLARLTLTTPGAVTIAVTKPDKVRTAAVTCVTSGGDGNCGTQVPAGTPLGTGSPADDRTAPVASLSGLRNGQVFSRKRAPRTLRGTHQRRSRPASSRSA